MQRASSQAALKAGQGLCPYLGLKADSETCLRFPSHANYCHRASPPDSVRLQFQADFCQTARHTECEVFRREKVGPLPSAIRGRPVAKTGAHGGTLILLLLIIVLAVVAGLVWFGETSGLLTVPGLEKYLGVAAPSSPTTTVLPELSPTPASPTLGPLFPQDLITFTPVPTSADLAIQPTYFDPSADTPTPISTAGGWCGHELDVPFGRDPQLIIHRMGGGDSLNKFEITYRTSVKAIEGINLQFRIPVPRETVLVIPLDRTEVGSLPIFEPMQVSESNIPIQTMAFKAKSDLLAFERYNAFDESCRFFIGWVVAPRERPAP
jgi:hypothetical protein